MKAIHARVSGRVQGVFFRASAAEEARRLGLAGWVRNRRDGSVEVFAQGAPGAVETLVAWLHEGPPLARVDRVDWREAALEPGRTDFSVLATR